MTISSLSASAYASLLAAQSGSASSTSASATTSGSIGDQLLAELAQSQAASGASSDPLLQDLVSLSPAALGQATTAPQTYNAQGLLQQVQSSLLLADPLLQANTTGATSDSLLQGLMSSPQAPTSATPAAGAPNAAGSTDPSANLMQVLQHDPALAGVLVESQMEQGMLAMLGP